MTPEPWRYRIRLYGREETGVTLYTTGHLSASEKVVDALRRLGRGEVRKIEVEIVEPLPEEAEAVEHG